MRNGPITSAIRDLPLQSQVLVWWEGPHLLVGIDENTCIVQLYQNSDKLSAFRITSVKPYLSSPNREMNEVNSFRQNDDDSTHKIHHKKDVTPSRIQPKRSLNRPNRLYAIYFQDKPVLKTLSQNKFPRDGFKTSRKIECRGIVNRNTVLPLGSARAM
ncbi:hypothetical protein GcM3_040037 [Golovinomyces cichoracearum]|uniref:Uncharacterized protein n=1 Tax=Golovinomyces cichoracearum TaxID=62708 RepID=A0A420J2L5_9PEZI|nr:hypothetical protein GcM3_040037 [Golovinomyces cichoracearum]